VDLTGRVLAEQKISKECKATIDVSGYSPGLYYYEFKSSSLVKTGKFVIE
jgi:hypothetical protein